MSARTSHSSEKSGPRVSGPVPEIARGTTSRERNEGPCIFGLARFLPFAWKRSVLPCQSSWTPSDAPISLPSVHGRSRASHLSSDSFVSSFCFKSRTVCPVNLTLFNPRNSDRNDFLWQLLVIIRSNHFCQQLVFFLHATLNLIERTTKFPLKNSHEKKDEEIPETGKCRPTFRSNNSL